MVFICKAIDSNGKKIKEEIEADSKKEAYNIIANRGWIPIDLNKKNVKEIKRKTSVVKMVKDKLKIKAKKIPSKSLVFLFYNLSIMINSGLPLDRALEITSKQMKKESGIDILDTILEEVKRGLSLSQAIAQTNAFPRLVVPIIQSGEESGQLQRSFVYLSDYYSKIGKNKSKVVSALIYPVIVLLGVIVAFYILSTNVLPQIVSSISENGGQLGFSTKVLISVSGFFKKFGIWSLVLIIGVPAGIVFGIKKMNKEFMDKWMIEIPVVGDMIKQSNTVQFTTTLYILLSSGVTLNRALEIAQDVIGNTKIQYEIENIRRGIMKGESMSSRLNEKIFGDVVTNIIQIGEESGQLDEPLLKSSEYLNEKLEESTKRLTDLMVPFTMLLVAVIVGFVVIGTLSPMMSMYKQ